MWNEHVTTQLNSSVSQSIAITTGPQLRMARNTIRSGKNFHPSRLWNQGNHCSLLPSPFHPTLPTTHSLSNQRVEREQVSTGVMRQKGSRHYERLTGVGSFCESVWLGESVLARDGWTAGYWFQSEAVDALRARRMAMWCSILE